MADDDKLETILELTGPNANRPLLVRAAIHKWWTQALMHTATAAAFVGFFAVTCPVVCQ
jgi:hypothetical protein